MKRVRSGPYLSALLIEQYKIYCREAGTRLICGGIIRPKAYEERTYEVNVPIQMREVGELVAHGAGAEVRHWYN